MFTADLIRERKLRLPEAGTKGHQIDSQCQVSVFAKTINQYETITKRQPLGHGQKSLWPIEKASGL